jgi:DNA-binding transcriptional ArsR family regulator
MMTVAIRLTPYRQARLAVYAERDAAVEALLRQHPDGLTTGALTARTGLGYEQIHHALNRLERRGVMLCEDMGLISIYTE